ncbi:hypothetical protein [Salinarimonas ramus]|uniref:Nickel/cobalt transporter regulator n=1 Tax=Salinarimonas ramus TaxID=690164 RepID=A0A917QB26_9HYPH|nr:hypothetical protein [Salinarimonas ramus]GGK37769.1 hypothetical protein GCM10011322_26020 [Salinarimonas ramus]
MRASFVATVAGFALLAAGPAFAQCSWESAAHEDAVVASTVEAPIVRDGERNVVVTPRRPAPREVIVTRGVPEVLGIRPAPVEPPAIYVIEAAGTVLVDPS